jgi:two-component system NtrC family response regulator
MEDAMTTPSRVRVLLVDDETTLLDYLSRRLSREGYAVKSAGSGEEALAAAAEEFFDVAVVDLKMGGIDGVETQRRLKGIQPFLQCIVLTGHGSIQTALQSGQQEAFQYLLKPTEYEDLLRTIQEAHAKGMALKSEEYEKRLTSLSKGGLSAQGLRKAISQLRRSLGMAEEGAP